MERQTIVGQIYGYGVSLIGVLIILASIHGIVSGVFNVVHPGAGAGRGQMVMMWRMHGGPGMMMNRGFGPGMMMHQGGGFMRGRAFMGGGKGMMPSPSASGAPSSMNPGDGNAMQPGPGGPRGSGMMRTGMGGGGEFAAIERLVLAIVMLIVGLVLFRWHWNWLHTARSA